jgi:hypothetical protein
VFSSVHDYLEAYLNGEVFEHIHQLEQFVENKTLENSV